MAVRLYHIDLAEHLEGNIVLFHEFPDFLLRTRLLFPKTVAREGQNSKSFLVLSLVQSSQLLVLQGGEASFGGDVDDEDDFRVGVEEVADFFLLCGAEGTHFCGPNVVSGI